MLFRGQSGCCGGATTGGGGAAKRGKECASIRAADIPTLVMNSLQWVGCVERSGSVVDSSGLPGGSRVVVVLPKVLNVQASQTADLHSDHRADRESERHMTAESGKTTGRANVADEQTEEFDAEKDEHRPLLRKFGLFAYHQLQKQVREGEQEQLTRECELIAAAQSLLSKLNERKRATTKVGLCFRTSCVGSLCLIDCGGLQSETLALSAVLNVFNV